MRLLFFLLSLAAYGQATIDLTPRTCTGNASAPRIAAMVPATLPGGAQVLVPVCLSLGAGVRISADGTAIETTEPAALPRQEIERISVDGTALFPLNYQIRYTPTPGTAVMVAYRNQLWGSDRLEFAPANGRSMALRVPTGALASPGEITLVYWTVEPLINTVKP